MGQGGTPRTALTLCSPSPVFLFQVPPIEESFDDNKHSLKPWDTKKVGAGPLPPGGAAFCCRGGCGEAATAASPAPACFLPGSVATPGPAVCFLPPNHGRPGLGERGINILAALHSSLISQLSSSSARPRSCEVPGIQ